jgi:DNA-binding transcriptional ArsR family regulator
MKRIESIASLIGEPTRAKILWNLLDGKAYTATELSIYADVSAQNASMHLSKLVQAELLAVEKQGRHKYYRFARPEVAYAMEAIANLIPPREAAQIPVSENAGIKFCRTCYDHLAGRVAVEITRQLLAKKIIVPAGSQYNVTSSGEKWFRDMDISVMELRAGKRLFARQCLDWSERKHHLAGALGAALLQAMVKKKWVRKMKDSRVTVLTNEGRIALHKRLSLLL